MTDRIRGILRWLSVRHSLRVEMVAVLLLYGLYETSRGLVAGHSRVASAHARDIVSLERPLHLFVERDVQQAAQAVPGLLGTLGVLYLTLHLSVTGGYLLWLHRRRPAAFPFVRTTLLVASGLALVGYYAFPTAPPRLAGVGVVDTISSAHVDLNHGLISSLYNPFAAVPSMHVGYALIVGASLLRDGARRSVRIIGALYPALVVLVIVATGNHFLLDAVAGAVVACVAAGLALRMTRSRARAAAPGASNSRLVLDRA
jgi:PAP2 superfamily